MRTLDEALNQFAYHPATAETAPKHAMIREEFRVFLAVIWPYIPDGPEKTLVMRKLQEAQMYANLAIALTTPADTTTPHVARVMPTVDASEEATCFCGIMRLPGNELSLSVMGKMHRRLQPCDPF